jgi:CRP/FNR family transcriptional regulator
MISFGNDNKNKVNKSLFPPNGGPSFVVPALWSCASGNPRHVIADESRAELAAISSLTRFRTGERIYGEGDRADAVFNLITGVVKAYKSLPGARRHIVAFLFPDDLIGLAEEGRYVNSAEAVTATCGYRIPATTLEARLRKDPCLEFHVICKLCHELREAQRHALILSRHSALVKVGLFLQMLDNYEAGRGGCSEELYLPMSRTDIADYLGMSLEVVSRSFRALASQGVIAFRNRRHVRIIDRSRLDNITLETERPALLRRRSAGQ